MVQFISRVRAVGLLVCSAPSLNLTLYLLPLLSSDPPAGGASAAAVAGKHTRLLMYEV